MLEMVALRRACALSDDLVSAEQTLIPLAEPQSLAAYEQPVGQQRTLAVAVALRHSALPPVATMARACEGRSQLGCTPPLSMAALSAPI